MAATTKFEIGSENFDLFFEQQLASISSSAKENMPKDVAYKIYRGGSKSNTKSTSKLSFIAKLWILYKFLKKRIWIVVEDTENGLAIKDFMDLRDAIAAKEKIINPFEEVVDRSCTFITANKELSDCFAALNNASASPAYNYLQKAKNGIKVPKNKVDEYLKAMKGVMAMIIHYEGNKKKFISQKIISMPEFYVLAALYHGKPMAGSVIYKEKLKYSYQSSRGKTQFAFTTLQNRGYITKKGTTKGAIFEITSLGVDAINSIASKYIVNC